jgi:hypothetical protein
VCGTHGGSIWYLRNEGTPTQYNFTVVTQNLVQNVGINAVPTLVDIDGDGDLDLFVGTGAQGSLTPFGGIWYFENIGTAQAYNFQYITKSYFDIDVGCCSVPRLVDIDADGDLDLFISNANGRMSFWRNEGTVSNPQFVLIDEWYQSLAMGGNSSIEFVDLVFEKLVEINKTGVSILVVEQNAAMALEIAHCGYVFNIGKIVLEDSGRNLLNNEDVKKAFFGG